MSNYKVDIIKCQNKVGNDTIKELHYKANAILFKLAHSYIMRNRTIRCGKALKEIAESIKALEVTDKAKAKKNEVINAIDKALAYLRTIAKQEPSTEEIQKTINYTVSCYLQKKPETLNDAIQLISEMKTLVSDLGNNDLSSINLKAFRKMGEELKAYIDREIEISI